MTELAKLQRDNEELMQRERDLQKENRKLEESCQKYKDEVRVVEAPTRLPTHEMIYSGRSPTYGTGFQASFRESPMRTLGSPDVRIQNDMLRTLGSPDVRIQNNMGSRLKVLEDIHEMIRKHRP